MNKYCMLIVLGLIFAGQSLCWAQQDAPKPRRQPEQLRVALSVDGTDRIYVQGSDLWIVHETSELPTDIKINGRKWDCQWSGKTSDRYHQVGPAFKPSSDAGVRLRKTKGLGGVKIIEKPSAGNGSTVCIQIADAADGADEYEFVLSWEP